MGGEAPQESEKRRPRWPAVLRATYLLDTSVIVDILTEGGRKALLDSLLRAGNTLACCAINAAEVYAGMRPHEAEATDALLKSLDYYPIDWEVAKRAGEIKFNTPAGAAHCLWLIRS